MTVTDLRDVWCADIDTTDMRVQADGKWVQSFAVDSGLTQEFVVNPFFLLDGEEAIMPTVGVRRDQIEYPNGAASVWSRMDNIWFGYATPTITDTGMWAPANIGWKPSTPVRWNLTDSDADIREVAAAARSLRIDLDLNSGNSVGVSNVSFQDSTADSTRLWTAYSEFGLVFVEYDYSSAVRDVTAGVIGTTWLPATGVHSWDFFSGSPNSIRIDVGERFLVVSLTSANVLVGSPPISSQFQITGDVFSISGREAKQSAAMLWYQNSFSSASVSEAFANSGTMSVTFTWNPIGAAGVDMIGGGNGTVS